MTIEEHLRLTIGDLVIRLAQLQAEIDAQRAAASPPPVPAAAVARRRPRRRATPAAAPETGA